MEPREDMLPDVENTSGELPPKPVVENVQTPEPAPKEEDIPQEQPAPKEDNKPPKGFVPYQALDEERRKRKELEIKMKELESSLSDPGEAMSDEGKLLRQQIKTLNEKISFMEESAETNRLVSQYPQLTEHLDELDSFKSEYPGLSLPKVAKIFMAEKGLFEPKSVPRKGLERPTYGPKTPPKEGIDDADFDRLMKGDEKKLKKLIMSGQIE